MLWQLDKAFPVFLFLYVYVILMQIKLMTAGPFRTKASQKSDALVLPFVSEAKKETIPGKQF